MQHLSKPVLYFLILSVTWAVTYLANKVFQKNRKALEVNRDKIDEELNLLTDEIRYLENANIRMRNSLEKIAHLKHMVEEYGRTVSEEEILNSVIKNSFELFKGINRVLLYMVDTENQELRLARSIKKEAHLPVRMKKGDLFDHWVLKHRLPLLVEDIYKDFRFSPERFDKGFNSLISAPLTSEHKVLGVLRVDAKEKDKFTQSDLRFLDIIADISSVALQNSILYKRIEELAVHDSLTGLYVHSYFVARLKDEVKSSLRNGRDISLLMMDLDDFKAYNDKYGHTAGDLILKHISSILKGFASPGDIVSRYGGEEFAFLLLNKNKSRGAKVAEDIIRKVNQTPLVLRREETRLTLSIGVSSLPSEEKMAEELLRLSDSRLYKAKQEGKNRVCSE